MRVLVELHSCFHGFAGIPQETRLMTRALATAPLVEVGGMINLGRNLRSARGSCSRLRDSVGDLRTQARIVGEIRQNLSREKSDRALCDKLLRRYDKSWAGFANLLIRNRLFGDDLHPIDGRSYGDFLWQLFEATLSPDDKSSILRSTFYAIHTGRRAAIEMARYPSWMARINTEGWDFLIAQTPFPYRVSAGTRLIVRYHDAIPLLFRETISEGSSEAEGHLRALVRNDSAGALFVCISEPVREDLLRLVPSARERSFVIPDTVSPAFWPEPGTPEAIASIVQRRDCPASAFVTGKRTPPEKADDLAMPDAASTRPAVRKGAFGPFVLAVSTLEPRKNYPVLIEAWLKARERMSDPLDLVLVANPGWRYEREARLITASKGRGLFHLRRVPTDELRALYSAAYLVVCPSIAEGFDLSGVEAMRCGAPVIASDIPTHRWVYGDAALYFDPRSSDALAELFCDHAPEGKCRDRLVDLQSRGRRRADPYTFQANAPRWATFLEEALSKPLPE